MTFNTAIALTFNLILYIETNQVVFKCLPLLFLLSDILYFTYQLDAVYFNLLFRIISFMFQILIKQLKCQWFDLLVVVGAK